MKQIYLPNFLIDGNLTLLLWELDKHLPPSNSIIVLFVEQNVVIQGCYAVTLSDCCFLILFPFSGCHSSCLAYLYNEK